MDIILPKPKKRPQKWLLFFGLGCWLASILAVGWFLWNWRNPQWPPDSRVAIGLFGTLALLGFFVLLVSLKRLIFGPDRFGAMVGLFLGLVPILLWPVAYIEMTWNAETGHDLPAMIQAPLTNASANVAEIEAMYRYPRRSKGEYLTLIDQGQPDDPQPILDEMDELIALQCEILEANLERVVYWVRGPLLGSSNRHLSGWAIGDGMASNDQPVSENDKRVISISTLNLLRSANSAPPALLVRGWGNYWGYDQEELRQRLSAGWSNLASKSVWNAVVSSNASEVAINDIDILSGPIVEYLLLQGDGAQFFQLVNATSPTEFQHVYQEAYGLSWSDTFEPFQAWLVSQNPLPADSNRLVSQPEPTPIVATINRLQQYSPAPNLTEGQWQSHLQEIASAHERHQAALSPGYRLTKTLASKTTVENSSETLPVAVANRPLLKQTEVTKTLVTDEESLYSYSSLADSIAYGVTEDFAFEATRSAAELARRGKKVREPLAIQALQDKVKTSLRQLGLLADPLYQIDQFAQQEPALESVTEQNQLLRITQVLRSPAIATENRVEFTIALEQDCLLSNLLLLDGSTPIREIAFANELQEDQWRLRQLENFEYRNGQRLSRSVANLEELSPTQRRSFRDELKSINVSVESLNQPMPTWMSQLRVAMLGWCITALVLAFGFALMRL